MPARIDIKPDLLTWAIHRAGLAIDMFLIDYPKAEKWLTGEQMPTLRQLRDFAKKVHVPFGYLLLEKPPEEESIIPFFRTNGGDEPIPLAVKETVQVLEARQDWLSKYLQEIGAQPLSFVGSLSDLQNRSVDEAVTSIRTTLGLEQGWAKKCSSWERALTLLTNAIEEVGIIVTFNGVVGNNTRWSIPVEDCRGFVLVDDYAPFLFVNNKDAKSAQMFTLIHEVTHIWVGKSAGFDLQKTLPADDPIENFCNSVAAEFLVPREELQEVWGSNSSPESLARHFKVSPIVVARRALDLGIFGRDEFFAFYNYYMDKIANLNSSKSGGNFDLIVRRRLSPKFMSYVNQAVRNESLPYKQAYSITGLKSQSFHRIMAENFGDHA